MKVRELVESIKYLDPDVQIWTSYTNSAVKRLFAMDDNIMVMDNGDIVIPIIGKSDGSYEFHKVTKPSNRQAVIPPSIKRIIDSRPQLLAPALLGILSDHSSSEFTWIDLAKAPHMLVGGATGSGKSIFLRGLVVSATASLPPSKLRLILIDPKRVELSRFKGLPHVAAYANDEEKASEIIHSLYQKMETRLNIMDANKVRDISDTTLPRIVVVIDEFADIVLGTRKTPNEVETPLSRLLSKGRAAGIHVILSTQRPDANIVTGIIKANTPTRVAFHTTSSIESRIILDCAGAEGLPGAGSGLLLSSQIINKVSPGSPISFRSHLFSEADIDEYVEAQNGN